MSRLTVGFGVVLILIGTVGYAASGAASVTALIPTFIGALMAAAGWMMTRSNLYKAGLYSAIVLAVVMALGSLRGVMGILGGDFSAPYLIQAVLLLASIAYLFIAGKNARASRRS